MKYHKQVFLEYAIKQPSIIGGESSLRSFIKSNRKEDSRKEHQGTKKLLLLQHQKFDISLS